MSRIVAVNNPGRIVDPRSYEPPGSDCPGLSDCQIVNNPGRIVEIVNNPGRIVGSDCGIRCAMKHRIRAAGLLVKDEEILLIEHTWQGRSFWIPPGGGLDPQDENTIETIVREVKEEANLHVEEMGPLVYVREFAEPSAGVYHLEQFRLVMRWSGDLSLERLKGLGGDEHVITQARFIPRQELRDLTVYPVELRNDFWERIAQPEITAVHLGMTKEGD